MSLWYCSLSSLYQHLHFLFVAGFHNDTDEQWVHIDTFSAMNGISRFCESDSPWRYSLLLAFALCVWCSQLTPAWMQISLYLMKKLIHVNQGRHAFLSGTLPLTTIQWPNEFRAFLILLFYLFILLGKRSPIFRAHLFEFL